MTEAESVLSSTICAALLAQLSQEEFRDIQKEIVDAHSECIYTLGNATVTRKQMYVAIMNEVAARDVELFAEQDTVLGGIDVTDSLVLKTLSIHLLNAVITQFRGIIGSSYLRRPDRAHLRPKYVAVKNAAILRLEECKIIRDKYRRSKILLHAAKESR